MIDKWMNSFFKSISIRYWKDLKDKIWISEKNYHFVAGYSFSDTRWFFLIWILDDILRVWTAMIRWDEILSENKEIKDDFNDWIPRIIYESIYYEQLYWKRKMIEHLINITLFFDTNEQFYYKIYLLSISLNKVISIKKDFKDFYELKNEKINKNLEYQFNELINNINIIVNKESINNVWFLDNSFPLKKNIIFKSKKDLIKLILKNDSLDTNKILLIWENYIQNYWRTSDYIHASSWEAIKDISSKEILWEYSYLGMLNITILIDIYNLLWIEMKWDLENINKLNEEWKFKELNKYSKSLNIKYWVWDLIFCWDELCEILEVIESEYWFKSYKIKYLVKSPLWEVDKEDFIPYNYIQTRILIKKEAKKYFQLFKEKSPNNLKELIIEMWKLKNLEIYMALKRTFIELHTHWVLIHMYAKK